MRGTKSLLRSIDKMIGALQTDVPKVIENKVGVDLVIETRMKEKNSLYAKVNYVPSKGTQPCKLLVFGYKVMD
jgi:hypothetical protein